MEGGNEGVRNEGVRVRGGGREGVREGVCERKSGRDPVIREFISKWLSTYTS